MKRILFFLTLLLLIVQFAFAQTTYTGCVLYDNSGNPVLSSPIYITSRQTTSSSLCGRSATFTNVTTNYSLTTPAKSLNSYCSILPSLAITGDNKYRDCHVFTLSGAVCGVIRTIRVVECPIDGLEILLLVISAFLGLAIISPSLKLKLLNYKVKQLRK